MVVFRFWKLLLLLLSLPILLGGFVFAGQAGSMVTFRGEVDYSGEGLCRGMVLLWSAEGRSALTPERSNLVPDWVVELDSECRFEVKAPPGSYYLQAVVRQTSGHALGPPRIGDLVFTSGDYLQVNANAGGQVHLGTLAKRSDFTGYSEHVETGITGRLIDEKGMPIAGLKVFAYLDENMVSGLYAVSQPSDADGRFFMHLANKTELYLQARGNLSIGRRSMESLVGFYGDKTARRVTVEPGKPVAGVEIVVAPLKKGEAATEN